MSVQATTPPAASATRESYDYDYDEEGGNGWVVFAGVMLLILGTVNFIEGLAAIGNANFFVHNTHYVAGSLNTWGWVVLCIGVIEWIVGRGVFIRSQLSRRTGVVILSVNAVIQLLMLPAYPWWSLCIFTLDILAIYGLIAHGKKISSLQF